MKMLCSLISSFEILGYPLKWFFLAWEASLGKVLTLKHLKKKGRALTNKCFLCGKEEETVDHLLVHCPHTRVLWELLLAIVGVKWVFPLRDPPFLGRFFCGEEA